MLAASVVAALGLHLGPLPAGLARVGARPRASVVAAAPEKDKSEIAGMGLFDEEGRPDGAHGTGYRFMPLSAMSKDSSPVLMTLAGAYPGLTSAQLLAPQPLPFAEPGKWNYHMLTGDAMPGGFVALPGTSVLDERPNTVGVVCTSTSLGLEFPDNGEHEVLALIDRSDSATVDASAFDNKAFYALADEAGNVAIRWIQELPAGWTVLGKLLYAQMPLVNRPGAGSGFAENDDEFEF